jgi:hypothetical protein
MTKGSGHCHIVGRRLSPMVAVTLTPIMGGGGDGWVQ